MRADAGVSCVAVWLIGPARSAADIGDSLGWCGCRIVLIKSPVNRCRSLVFRWQSNGKMGLNGLVLIS